MDTPGKTVVIRKAIPINNAAIAPFPIVSSPI
jgi:hypothetical protein